MEIAGTDILLPTMMVGNYPKPRWWMGAGFANVPIDQFPGDSISFEAFQDALAGMVRDQEESGLDIISDARVLDSDSPYVSIVKYFIDRVDGIEYTGAPLALPTYSTISAPAAVGPLSRRAPMLMAQLKELKKLTNKPVKLQYTGPQAMVMALENQYYDDPRDLAFALAKVYNQELREMADNGADVIQLDEFTWHFGLSLGKWEVDVFNECVEGVDATVIAHACWGNYMGTSGYLPEGPMHGDAPDKEGTEYVLSLRTPEARTRHAAALFPRVNNLNFDVLNFEVAHNGPEELAPLAKKGWDRPFVAGVIDVKSTVTETATEVADLIRECLKVIPADKLGLTTDCGLINLPRQIAKSKLRAMVEGANIVRAELEAGDAVDVSTDAELVAG